MIVIRTKEKMYVAGIAVGGNSPVARINEEMAKVLSDYPKLLGYPVVKLKDMVELLDQRSMTVVEAKSGDIFRIGSDGDEILGRLVEHFKSKVNLSGELKEPSGKKDDATAVIVTIA